MAKLNAYHIPVSITMLVLQAGIIIGIVSFVLAFKAYRGAVTNPVKILKYE